MSARGKNALHVSTICFGIVLAALLISHLADGTRTVRAQDPATETLFYSFRQTGAGPTGVIRDSSGNFYAATFAGGTDKICFHGCGAILKLSPSGGVTQLYAFPPVDTDAPVSPSALVMDSSGNLYGTTALGDNNAGSVYKLTPSGVFTTLHSFVAHSGDGYDPASGVTLDSAGNLFGTTTLGGGGSCGGGGCGAVYKVDPSGTETVLHAFTGADGHGPEASPLVDPAGNLYGTTATGGDLSCPLNSGFGCGTVWKLDTAGPLRVLHSFTGGADGAISIAGLVMDSAGNLYGVASFGGDLSCTNGGCGVVFKIDSSGDYTVLHTFGPGLGNGSGPVGTLLRDITTGNLYGTTVTGGTNGRGVAFKLDPSNNYSILHSFTGAPNDADGPNSALVSDGHGKLYGTTVFGGALQDGALYKIQLP